MPIDPRPWTLRELWDFAEGAWERTAGVMAAVIAANPFGGQAVQPGKFNPYHRAKPKTRAARAADTKLGFDLLRTWAEQRRGRRR